MKDINDEYVRRALKNWAMEQQPPANSRARLLLVAASIQREQADEILTVDPKDFASNLQSPLDQAMRIYNLAWLDISNVSFSPIRRVT